MAHIMASRQCVADPKTHTTSPSTSGTTVLAVKFKDGVLMACDTMGSYGSMARYLDVRRITSMGDTLVGGSGDISDFQYLTEFLKEMETEEECIGDGIEYSPKEVFSRLTRLLYYQRSQMNPYWNSLVVGGVDKTTDEVFLACTDKIGTPFLADYVATGFGLHLAKPILADKWREDLSEEEARELLKECLRVCYYRDARASNKVIFSKAERGKKVEIDAESSTLATKWDFEEFKQTTWEQ